MHSLINNPNDNNSPFQPSPKTRTARSAFPGPVCPLNVRLPRLFIYQLWDLLQHDCNNWRAYLEYHCELE